MVRNPSNVLWVCFEGLFLSVLVVCFVTGCGNGDSESPYIAAEDGVRYEIVSAQGFAVVEKAMPKIREMLLSSDPSDFHEMAELYSQIDAIDSVQERYASYRFMIDRLGKVGDVSSISRGRLSGVLYSASIDVFERLHGMNAPVKEKVHVWLSYIRKMDAEALWSRDGVRGARVDFVEKYIADMERLGYLRDSAERDEIEAEFLKVIGHPFKRKD